MGEYINIRFIINFWLIVAFLLNTFGPFPAAAQAQDFRLPTPGAMVPLSPEFNPPVLKGIKVHPDDPFRFDFILDKGDGGLNNSQLKDESNKLIRYFLATLTIPEKDLWVNLSPYEKDRIIPGSFGLTEMGRDLLAEDYILKQITASLIYPEDRLGKKFWKRIYEESAKKFGTTNIPVNTFNKVWIVPEKAIVYENANAGTAYVVESKLKVMLEQDYLAMQKNIIVSKDISSIGANIVREVVIPELTKEVNEDKNFAQLRQVYNSLILATWYKKKIKDSILSQVYTDKKKVAGVNIDDPQEKERIYQRYLTAFKKGVYNYIKEDVDSVTQEEIPRKYFAGGFDFAMMGDTSFADAPLKFTDKLPEGLSNDNAMIVSAKVDRVTANRAKAKQARKRSRNTRLVLLGAGLFAGWAWMNGGTPTVSPLAPPAKYASIEDILRDTEQAPAVVSLTRPNAVNLAAQEKTVTDAFTEVLKNIKHAEKMAPLFNISLQKMGLDIPSLTKVLWDSYNNSTNFKGDLKFFDFAKRVLGTIYVESGFDNSVTTLRSDTGRYDIGFAGVNQDDLDVLSKVDGVVSQVIDQGINKKVIIQAQNTRTLRMVNGKTKTITEVKEYSYTIPDGLPVNVTVGSIVHKNDGLVKNVIGYFQTHPAQYAQKAIRLMDGDYGRSLRRSTDFWDKYGKFISRYFLLNKSDIDLIVFRVIWNAGPGIEDPVLLNTVIAMHKPELARTYIPSSAAKLIDTVLGRSFPILRPNPKSDKREIKRQVDQILVQVNNSPNGKITAIQSPIHIWYAKQVDLAQISSVQGRARPMDEKEAADKFEAISKALGLKIEKWQDRISKSGAPIQFVASPASSFEKLIYMREDAFESSRFRKTLVFSRVGPLFFVDRRFFDSNGKQIADELGPNVIVVHSLENSLPAYNHGYYTTPMIMNMLWHDLAGKEVIDSGAGDGILSLAAYKLGATAFDMIDEEPEASPFTVQELYKKNLDAAHENFDVNGIANYTLHPGDLRDPSFINDVAQKVRQKIKGTRNLQQAVLLSNIGYWPDYYNVSNLQSLQLAQKIPEVTLFIGGGHNFVDPLHNMTSVTNDKRVLNLLHFETPQELQFTFSAGNLFTVAMSAQRPSVDMAMQAGRKLHPVTITGDMVKMFAFEGDRNPLHTDEQEAKKSLFKGLVSHGVLTTTEAINELLKSYPEYDVDSIQEELFLKPVYFGEELMMSAKTATEEDSKLSVEITIEKAVNGKPALIGRVKLTLSPKKEEKPLEEISAQRRQTLAAMTEAVTARKPKVIFDFSRSGPQMESEITQNISLGNIQSLQTLLGTNDRTFISQTTARKMMTRALAEIIPGHAIGVINNIRFGSLVKEGDQLTARIKVIEVEESYKDDAPRHKVKTSVEIRNQNNEMVLTSDVLMVMIMDDTMALSSRDRGLLKRLMNTGGNIWLDQKMSFRRALEILTEAKNKLSALSATNSNITLEAVVGDQMRAQNVAHAQARHVFNGLRRGGAEQLFVKTVMTGLPKYGLVEALSALTDAKNGLKNIPADDHTYWELLRPALDKIYAEDLLAGQSRIKELEQRKIDNAMLNRRNALQGLLATGFVMAAAGKSKAQPLDVNGDEKAVLKVLADSEILAQTQINVEGRVMNLFMITNTRSEPGALAFIISNDIFFVVERIQKEIAIDLDESRNSKYFHRDELLGNIDNETAAMHIFESLMTHEVIHGVTMPGIRKRFAQETAKSISVKYELAAYLGQLAMSPHPVMILDRYILPQYYSFQDSVEHQTAIIIMWHLLKKLGFTAERYTRDDVSDFLRDMLGEQEKINKAAQQVYEELYGKLPSFDINFLLALDELGRKVNIYDKAMAAPEAIADRPEYKFLVEGTPQETPNTDQIKKMANEYENLLTAILIELNSIIGKKQRKEPVGKDAYGQLEKEMQALKDHQEKQAISKDPVVKKFMRTILFFFLLEGEKTANTDWDLANRLGAIPFLQFAKTDEALESALEGQRKLENILTYFKYLQLETTKHIYTIKPIYRNIPQEAIDPRPSLAGWSYSKTKDHAMVNVADSFNISIGEHYLGEILEYSKTERRELEAAIDELTKSLSENYFIEMVRNITKDHQLNLSDLSKNLDISYHAQGVNKYVFEVTLKKKDGQDINFLLALRKSSEELTNDLFEFTDLSILKGQGVPRWGGGFVTPEKRIWFGQEFIEGKTLAVIRLIKKGLSEDQKLKVIGVLLGIAKSLDGAVPEDIRRENFIQRSGTNDIVMVDIGNKRLFIFGEKSSLKNRLSFLGNFLLSYGYQDTEKNSILLKEIDRLASEHGENGFINSVKEFMLSQTPSDLADILSQNEVIKTVFPNKDRMEEYAEYLLNSVKKYSAGDNAMAAAKGGIDLSPDNILSVQNSGRDIKFHIDPAMLQELQDAAGFTPVIINMQPMTNLRIFLGLAETSSSHTT